MQFYCSLSAELAYFHPPCLSANIIYGLCHRGPWKSQRKTLVRLLKKSGFQKSNLKSAVDHVWPRMKKAMVETSSIVMGLSEQGGMYI